MLRVLFLPYDQVIFKRRTDLKENTFQSQNITEGSPTQVFAQCQEGGRRGCRMTHDENECNIPTLGPVQENTSSTFSPILVSLSNWSVPIFGTRIPAGKHEKPIYELFR